MPRLRFSKPDLQTRYGEPECPPGQSLMQTLLSLGLPVASSCRGDGVCSKCRLRVHSTPGALSRPGALEKGLLAKINAEAEERISCQARLEGNGIIDVDAGYW